MAPQSVSSSSETSPRPKSHSSSSETSPKSKLQGTKRGRPKTETLPEKIREGEEQEGEYRCFECKRLFPRRKSLTAHERTHTDERPYQCTYPTCNRGFKQSGQLKTHLRRHTGEKPFACSYPGCQERYLHSNRHCRKHPQKNLVRDGNEEVSQGTESMHETELKWLENYRSDKENRAKRRRIDSGSSSDDSDKELKEIELARDLEERELLEKIESARKELEEKELLERIQSTRNNLTESEIISAYVLLTIGQEP